MQEAIHHQAHSNETEEGSEAVMNTASAAAPTLMRNQQAAHMQFSGMNHTIAGQNTQAAIHVWVNWNNGTASNTHISPVRWSETWLKLTDFVKKKYCNSWLMNSVY